MILLTLGTLLLTVIFSSPFFLYFIQFSWPERERKGEGGRESERAIPGFIAEWDLNSVPSSDAWPTVSIFFLRGIGPEFPLISTGD